MRCPTNIHSQTHYCILQGPHANCKRDETIDNLFEREVTLSETTKNWADQLTTHSIHTSEQELHLLLSSWV